MTLYSNISSINNAEIKTNNIGFKSNGVTKTQPYPNDSFETQSTKNEELSNLAKFSIGLGIIATGIGGFLLHKNYAAKKAIETNFKKLENNLPEVQKTFREVFMRNDLTEAETKEILQGYKDIEKIKSKEEYIKAVFEHAKKNYQIHNPDLKINITDVNDFAFGGIPCSNTQVFITKTGLKEDRKRLFEVIHHELRHAKQHEFMYHKNPNWSIKGEIYHDILIEKYKGESFIDYTQKLAKKFGSGDCHDKIVQEELDKTENMVAIVERIFGKPDINKVPKEYYDYVEKLESEMRTSIPYPQRFEEKDAFKAGQTIADLILKK